MEFLSAVLADHEVAILHVALVGFETYVAGVKCSPNNAVAAFQNEEPDVSSVGIKLVKWALPSSTSATGMDTTP